MSEKERRGSPLHTEGRAQRGDQVEEVYCELLAELAGTSRRPRL